MCGKLYCEVPEGRTTNLRNVYRSDLDYNETYQCTLAARPRAAISDNQDIAMVYDGTRCGDSEVSYCWNATFADALILEC